MRGFKEVMKKLFVLAIAVILLSQPVYAFNPLDVSIPYKNKFGVLIYDETGGLIGKVKNEKVSFDDGVIAVRVGAPLNTLVPTKGLNSISVVSTNPRVLIWVKDVDVDEMPKPDFSLRHVASPWQKRSKKDPRERLRSAGICSTDPAENLISCHGGWNTYINTNFLTLNTTAPESAQSIDYGYGCYALQSLNIDGGGRSSSGTAELSPGWHSLHSNCQGMPLMEKEAGDGASLGCIVGAVVGLICFYGAVICSPLLCGVGAGIGSQLTSKKKYKPESGIGYFNVIEPLWDKVVYLDSGSAFRDLFVARPDPEEGFDMPINACWDGDINGVCDYVEAGPCLDEGGDWFVGKCCGAIDYVEPEYVSEARAVCGKDLNNNWKWAPLIMPGKVFELSEPQRVNFISNTTDVLACEKSSFIKVFTDQGSLNSSIEPVNRWGELHEFICKANDIVECGGIEAFNEDAVFPGSSFRRIVDSETEVRFCTSGGKWVSDLDDSDKDACELAKSPDDAEKLLGFKWTGSKCCQDEKGEFYNDVFNFNNYVVSGNNSVISERLIKMEDDGASVSITGPLKIRIQRVSEQPAPEGGLTEEGCGIVTEDSRFILPDRTLDLVNKEPVDAFPKGTDCSYRNIYITPEVENYGGCWNGGFIGEGATVQDDAVINYKGEFYGCNLPFDSSSRALMDVFSNQTLVTNQNTCAMPLENALPEQHAKCEPFGRWGFTLLGDSYRQVVKKSIEWGLNDVVDAERPLVNVEGCCPSDQCWNGLDCTRTGDFYRLRGEKGYVCKT